MKGKRQKHVRKILAFYRTNFEIQAPYTILIDGTFCKSALKFKVNIKEQLPKYLDAEVKMLTTKCVLAECKAFGPLLYGPLKVLEQFACLNCGHDPPKPAAQCMRKQLKKKHRKYIIATQDRDLSESIREIPGKPLIFISHNAINLEAPSDASKQVADSALNDRLTPSQKEHQKIIALKKATFGEPQVKKRKRKGPKGPNPLSCKRKKTDTKPKKTKKKKINNLS